MYVQTQQAAVDTEGAWAKGNLHLACSRETSLSGPGFHKVSGALCGASFPFAGGGNNPVSREGDRAEVSSGSLQGSCSLTELMDC